MMFGDSGAIIGMKRKEKRYKEIIKKLLNKEDLSEEDYEKFIEERATLINDSLRKLADIELVKKIEEDELTNEIICIEVLLRKMIKKVLDRIDKGWFNNSSYIKEEKRKKFINNLEKDKRRNPQIKDDDIWDYVDIGTIIEIMENHPEKFRSLFIKDFIDYNLVLSIIRLMNVSRAKDVHGKIIYSITPKDIELLRIQIPNLKDSIESCLNKNN